MIKRMKCLSPSNSCKLVNHHSNTLLINIYFKFINVLLNSDRLQSSLKFLFHFCDLVKLKAQLVRHSAFYF